MKYDFDQVIDREGNNSSKYDERGKKFGQQDVIPLWVADMDFQVPQPVIEALEAKARHGIFGYTSRPDSYFDAVCQWQEKRNDWKPERSLISFCAGVIPAISAIIKEFTEQGDEILIQTPVYPEFESSIRAWDRKVLTAPLREKEGQYYIDYDEFEQALQRKPKLFILCNPHNPVGRVWSREELQSICQLCVDYKVPIISDEIHSDLILWGKKHIPVAVLSPEIADNVITCTSPSKAFNLAGLQAASIIFPNQEYKQKFDRLWENLGITRNNSFSVIAMEVALRQGEEWLEQIQRYIEGNLQYVRDYCQQNIPQLKPNLPECTYLIWIDCKALGMGDEQLAAFMVKEAGLGLNTGISFGEGGSGYMRLNAACPRSLLVQAMGMLKDAIDRRG